MLLTDCNDAARQVTYANTISGAAVLILQRLCLDIFARYPTLTLDESRNNLFVIVNKKVEGYFSEFDSLPFDAKTGFTSMLS